MTSMTSAAHPPHRQITRLLVSCALAMGSMTAWSADTAASSALKALLGPQMAFQQTGGLPPTPAHSAGGAEQTGASPPSSAPVASAMVGRTVTVQRGETLDRVIRRALPDVPLHPDFLRKAFVSLNPQVFPEGAPNRMRAGTQLQVPSMAALRQMLLSQHPGSAALLQGGDAPSEAQTPIRASSPSGPSGSQRWVRFP